MPRRDDFVDGHVQERAGREPEFPALVEAALERRKLLRELAACREDAGISQTVIAARMGTSQSAVARIETGEADVRLSTVGRYAAAVGRRVSWTIARNPAAVVTRKSTGAGRNPRKARAGRRRTTGTRAHG